jgi:hypothetical protein
MPGRTVFPRRQERPRPSGKIVAKSDDLAVNADIRFDHSHAE